MKVIIINGPNLNLLGKREPETYGNRDFNSYFDELKTKYPLVKLDYFQSNHEGALIDKLHEVGFDYDGIILNAGGFTHTSVALTDAVAAISTPVLEVHISNVHARENFRHHSYLSKNCVGVLLGMGIMGYELALQYFIKKNAPDVL